VSDVQWIALDIETTGVSIPRGHRLTEIALLDDFGGSFIADTDQSSGFESFAIECRGWLTRGVVVGHNVVFDLKFLASEFGRIELAMPAVLFVDTLYLVDGQPKTLLESARRLGVTCEPRRMHRADYDARVAHDVLQSVIERDSPTTLGDLNVRVFRQTGER
jgi:DNA polymerase III epsilon subunit-like protein